MGGWGGWLALESEIGYIFHDEHKNWCQAFLALAEKVISK